ncbi:hypothetical protein CNR22_08935 [Sphingobacteriaceae bacterium]|nr:hypothetical protein CNR22_08935 [Sphingobacteriaceae bacterium]
MTFRNLFSLLLIFISFRTVAQSTGTLIIFHELRFEGAAYTMKVYNHADSSVVATRTYDCQEEMQLDSIEEGKYRLEVRETNSNRLFFSREITVFANDITRLYVDLDISETRDSADSLSGRTGDGEFNLGYQNGRLQSPNSVFRSGFMIGMGLHSWKIKHRHFASIFGFGFNYHYIKIAGDTSFIAAPVSYKKTEEAYHYLNAHLDYKVRLCSRNQKSKTSPPGFIAEVGAIYNFPLYFRYRGNYEGNKIIQAWGIHQFTDFRAFVNVGYYPFLFFYDYRLSDFVIGKYPEMPRSTFGIRILLATISN